MAKLAATGLIKIYGGRKVVNEINLEIHPGEVVGLLDRTVRVKRRPFT
jgi:ABC-type lipopolysaccharide export system ATPase subunit